MSEYRFDVNAIREETRRRLSVALESSERALAAAMNGSFSYPLVLRVGSSRSGSTLFMQWAALTGAFGYASNIMGLMPNAPLVGAHLQALMTDARLRQGSEFDDLIGKIDLSSVSGRTRGAAAPQEFWEFWLRYFSFPRTPIDSVTWAASADFDAFRRDISALIGFTQRPFLLKAHNLTYYLCTFADRVPEAVFVHMYRDPIDVIVSILRARLVRYGDPDEFFGWRPRDFNLIRHLPRVDQVAGQVYLNEQAIVRASDCLGDRLLVMGYHDFCADPRGTFSAIRDFVARHSKAVFEPPYHGPEHLTASVAEPSADRRAAEVAFARWTESYGPLRYADGATWA